MKRLTKKIRLEILDEVYSMIESGQQTYICCSIQLQLIFKGLDDCTDTICRRFRMKKEDARRLFKANGDISWWHSRSDFSMEEIKSCRLDYIQYLKKLQ